ncbi:MAG TPA: pilus assembly protein TadG-related protein [Anaerolineales bacterium]|nr:pilus assembly protein TadG-related protein [Anaerolineales bacterium]
MVLAVGIGRYFYARTEMFKSADGAALAAVQEVDVRVFLDTGQIVLLSLAYGRAQEYAWRLMRRRCFRRCCEGWW